MGARSGKEERRIMREIGPKLEPQVYSYWHSHSCFVQNCAILTSSTRKKSDKSSESKHLGKSRKRELKMRLVLYLEPFSPPDEN